MTRDFLELLGEFDEGQRIKVQLACNLELGAMTHAVMMLARRRRCLRISKAIHRNSGHRWARARREGIRYLFVAHRR